MKIYLHNHSDQFRNRSDWHQVTLPSDHCNMNRVSIAAPAPDNEMREWLENNCDNDVYVSCYVPIYANGNDTVSHFVIDIWFSDANEAMMFKLAWA